MSLTIKEVRKMNNSKINQLTALVSLLDYANILHENYPIVIIQNNKSITLI